MPNGHQLMIFGVNKNKSLFFLLFPLSSLVSPN